MRTYASLVLSCFLALLSGLQNASAQSVSGENEDRGWELYEYFVGSSNSLGQVLKMDTSVGYDINEYFGVDGGLPVYFVHASPSSTVNGFASGNGIGNAYVDLRLTVINPTVDFLSTLTGTAPTGNTSLGLSTGRVTFDWDNHFDHNFGPLRPFADVGVANSISDTPLFIRPYTTLGFVSHLEGGGTLRVQRFIRVGASLYDYIPSGQQKIFSRFNHGQSGGGVALSRHSRPFENASETVGSADIARDNGFSAWVESSRLRVVHLEAGYTRSVHFALNTFSFGVGVNVGPLVRRIRGD